MATAEKITYSDPSAQLVQLFSQLGGEQKTGSTTSTTGADPAAIDSLHQLLTTQMGGTTPEGITALINGIFQEGAKKVPGIQTAYGQAVGARATGNSATQLALGDLQTQLASEALKQLLTAQSNAGTTASRLADATQTKTVNQGQTTKPASTVMTYLPFILGQAGKLKKLADGTLFGNNTGSSGGGMFSSGSSGSGDVDRFTLPNFGGYGASDAAGSAGSAIGDMAFDSGADMFGFDYGVGNDIGSGISDAASNIFDSGSDGIDIGSFFADGGLVDTAKMRLAAVPGAEAAFNSGGDEKEVTTKSRKTTSDPADEVEDSKKLAGKDLTGQKSIAVRLFDRMRGYDKRPGYANGGRVTASTDFTRSMQDYLRSGGKLRGVNQQGSYEPDQLSYALNGLFDFIGSGRGKSTGTTVGRRAPAGISYPSDEGGAGSSGVGEGTTNGPVGTPAENAAALGGMGIAAANVVSPALGFALGIAMDALGISHSSMNPVSHIASLVQSIVSNASDSPPDGLPGTMSAPDADGFSSAADNGMSTGGMADGTSSDGEGGSATSGEGSGEGGGGVGEGGGTGGFKAGGKIKGPGTGTSDSIQINASNGEYIMPKDSVDFFGVDMLDWMRSISHTPVANQQQGAQ